MQVDKTHPQTDMHGKYCLSTAYLAPVEYYQILANAAEIWLERHEYYLKQSYRNRCIIATANGLMDLTIPVEKPEQGKVKIRDVRIAYHGNWQVGHWRAIESAYGSSPFFEYYADELVGFYEKKWVFLWDFNFEIQQKILELADLQPTIRLSDSYEAILKDDIIDLRMEIHPKKKPYRQNLSPYYQVFRHKYGFRQNLSILDLLLNMGNETILTLKSKEK